MLAVRLYSISLAKCFYQEYFLYYCKLASTFLSAREWWISKYLSGMFWLLGKTTCVTAVFNYHL